MIDSYPSTGIWIWIWEWLRGLCKQLGGFEPKIAALANSHESLIGMVAAGRGVFVGPEICYSRKRTKLEISGKPQ
jgi:DNA-binding transcriptional LysR family regulator